MALSRRELLSVGTAALVGTAATRAAQQTQEVTVVVRFIGAHAFVKDDSRRLHAIVGKAVDNTTHSHAAMAILHQDDVSGDAFKTFDAGHSPVTFIHAALAYKNVKYRYRCFKKATVQPSITTETIVSGNATGLLNMREVFRKAEKAVTPDWDKIRELLVAETILPSGTLQDGPLTAAPGNGRGWKTKAGNQTHRQPLADCFDFLVTGSGKVTVDFDGTAIDLSRDTTLWVISVGVADQEGCRAEQPSHARTFYAMHAGEGYDFKKMSLPQFDDGNLKCREVGESKYPCAAEQPSQKFVPIVELCYSANFDI